MIFRLIPIFTIYKICTAVKMELIHLTVLPHPEKQDMEEFILAMVTLVSKNSLTARSH